MCPRVAARVEQPSATYHSWLRLKRPNRLVGRGSAMVSAGRLHFMRPTVQLFTHSAMRFWQPNPNELSQKLLAEHVLAELTLKRHWG